MTETLENFAGVKPEGPFAFKASRDQPITEHFDGFEQLDGAQKVEVIQVRDGTKQECLLRLPGQAILVEHSPVEWFDGTVKQGWGYTIRRIHAQSQPPPSPLPDKPQRPPATVARPTRLPADEPVPVDPPPAPSTDKPIAPKPPKPNPEPFKEAVAPAPSSDGQTLEEQLATLKGELSLARQQVFVTKQASEQQERALKAALEKAAADVNRHKAAYDQAKADLARLAQELEQARAELADGKTQFLERGTRFEREQASLAEQKRLIEASRAELQAGQEALAQKQREDRNKMQQLREEYKAEKLRLQKKDAELRQREGVLADVGPEPQEGESEDQFWVPGAGASGPTMSTPRDERRRWVRAGLLMFLVLITLVQCIVLAVHLLKKV